MNLLKKVAILFVSFSLVAVGTVSAKDFKPKKPIELIIMAGQGGGADEIARLVQGIAEKNDFTSKPLIPINKPGGSGGEALTYVKGRVEINTLLWSHLTVSLLLLKTKLN